jgi:hypothetical protein
MERFPRHVWNAVASASLTGGAVLGTGGAASAAVKEGVAQSEAFTVPVQRGIRDDHDAGGYGYGRLHAGERADGWTATADGSRPAAAPVTSTTGTA